MAIDSDPDVVAELERPEDCEAEEQENDQQAAREVKTEPVDAACPP